AIADGSTESYTWDARNRLVSVVDKDSAGHQTQKVTYTYDALDRRISVAVQSSSGTVVKDYVYDRDNVLLEFQGNSTPSTPALTEHNLFGPAVDQILAQDHGASRVSWLLADYLGSIRDVVNNAGALVDHLEYDAFGNLIAETNAAMSARYRFTGREFDAETG